MDSDQMMIQQNVFRETRSYLLPTELLHVRLVEKFWNREARIGLKRSGKLGIKLSTADRMNKFLHAFAPPQLPMRLLPVVDVAITPQPIQVDNLETFGLTHGENIHSVTIQFPKILRPSTERKAKIVLKHFVNLQKLAIRTNSSEDDLDFDFGEFSVTDNLQVFQNLWKLDIQCPTSTVGLLNELVAQTPNLRCVCLELVEVRPLQTEMKNFLEKLKSFQVSSLTMTLFLDDPPEETLLKAITVVRLIPKELCLRFRVLDKDGLPRETLLGGKQLLQTLLEKMTSSLTLEKLTLRCTDVCLLRVHFPAQLIPIRTLDFGIKDTSSPFQFSGAVEPIQPLDGAQVPNLHSLVAGGNRNPMSTNVVFSDIMKLTIQGYHLPQFSSTWSTQFPNLTYLKMYVLPGVESDLKPIFAKMQNLLELSLTFNFPPGNSCTEIWDVITGGIRPVMGKQSPIQVITSEHPPPTVTSEGSQVPSLQNLNRLQMLTLEMAPPCLFNAIVHFTAMKSLPRLHSLKISIAHAHDFKPDEACLGILGNYHYSVHLKNC